MAQAHPGSPKAQALWVALGLSALLHLGFFFYPLGRPYAALAPQVAIES